MLSRKNVKKLMAAIYKTINRGCGVPELSRNEKKAERELNGGLL